MDFQGFFVCLEMIQWHKNLDSVSHTEASSGVWDGIASSCYFTGQGRPVGPASYLTPRARNGRATQTIFAYIWATDIIIKAVCTRSPELKLHSGFHFIGGEKKSDWYKAHLFSLSFFFFFISGQQTKKSMTPTALIDISMLNENGPWFQLKWQHWVID